jgi:hypothetical protein
MLEILYSVLYGDYNKAFYQKTCVGTCTNFQRKLYRPEKKRQKGEFLSFYFYTLLLGITT